MTEKEKEPLIEKGRDYLLAKRVTRNIKRLTKKYWWLGLLLLLLAGCFYWFQLRPAKIRQECYEYMRETGSKDDSVGLFNNLYRSCLVKRGLKAETVFLEMD